MDLHKVIRILHLQNLYSKEERKDREQTAPISTFANRLQANK